MNEREGKKRLERIRKVFGFDGWKKTWIAKGRRALLHRCVSLSTLAIGT